MSDETNWPGTVTQKAQNGFAEFFVPFVLFCGAFKIFHRLDFNVSITISGVTPKRTGMMLVPIPVVTKR